MYLLAIQLTILFFLVVPLDRIVSISPDIPVERSIENSGPVVESSGLTPMNSSSMKPGLQPCLPPDIYSHRFRNQCIVAGRHRVV